MTFATPEAVEDAYYDALEAGGVEDLLSLWDTGDDVVCGLPMAAMAIGRDAVEAMWRDALETVKRIDLQVRHLGWIRTDDIAIHLVEELPPGAPGQTTPPVYATNIYRKRDDGWRMILHQNSPPPPPPGPESGAFPHLP